MTTTTRPRRPTALRWSVEDDAGLTAILDAPRPARAAAAPVAPPALPSGYAVRLDGTIATLTLPNGGCCAFDGRERTASGYGGADAGRALEAAHTEAQRHATIAMHPPVVGRRGAIRIEEGV